MHWCPCILLNKRRHDGSEVNKETLTARGEGGGLPYKKDGILVVPLEVKKAVLVPLKVFSLKRFTAGAVAAPFRVLRE